MELPHIGKHCQHKSCNRLDYLPFTCKHCQGNFCEDHWKPDGHSCSMFESQKNTKEILSENNSSQSIPSKTIMTTKPKKKRKQNPCQLPNCSGYNLVRMGCGDCGLNFCVKHRFPEEHKCLKRFNSRFSRLLAVN